MPKWALRLPDGRRMGEASLEGLTGFDRCVVAINAQRASIKQAREAFGDVEIVDVGESPSQVETAVRAVGQASIEGPVSIRDCDSIFRTHIPEGNSIACADLHTVGLINAGNKSYALARHSGEVVCVAERSVVSHMFCCGLYNFADAGVFCGAALGGVNISDVINKMVRMGEMFRIHPIAAYGYVDLGTYEDWLRYGGAP